MNPVVAALFVDRKGPYFNDPRCECWDEQRDARKYEGPLPVVAHPPCQRWINFAALNFKRYGGEHNRPGNDGGCFAYAVHCIFQWGGVLEHPADSTAFQANALPRPIPSKLRWQRAADDVWVCEVWQSAYGHRARKRTWLLYCGEQEPFELNWSRPEGTHQCGWFDQIKPTLGKREASLTPPLFADALIQLAIHSRKQ